MSNKRTETEVIKFLEELTALCQEHDIYIPNTHSSFDLHGDNAFGSGVELAACVEWDEKIGYVAMYNLLAGGEDE